MKAQISRDSFDPRKRYSGVFQQQGRMLTDADWNEMVQILKHRTERTVGAAIDSGSPREGGILDEDAVFPVVSSAAQPESADFPPAFVTARVNRLRWGRVYVDGVYAEVQPREGVDPDVAVGIEEWIEQQADFPDNPITSIGDGDYMVFVDVWERLVVALYDDHDNLRDPALHGADTCVRTQTMAQIKIAPIPAETQNVDLANLLAGFPAQGDAPLKAGSPVKRATGTDGGSIHNMLFRLEVHDVVLDADGKPLKVVLKWSTENGAELRRNDGKFEDGFAADPYVYECFDEVTERHLGIHPMAAAGVWRPQRGELYTHQKYTAAGSRAQEKPFIRRWDGMATLSWFGSAWILNEPETAAGNTKVSVVPGRNRPIIGGPGLPTKVLAGELRLDTPGLPSLVLGTSLASTRYTFVPGDHWLVLLRDDGTEVSARILQPEPVGIHHSYMDLGRLTKDANGFRFTVTRQQWRKLSFPSLTRLTIDRVLIEDQGNEVDVREAFVRRSGDEMTGPLKLPELNAQTVNARADLLKSLSDDDLDVDENASLKVGAGAAITHRGVLSLTPASDQIAVLQVGSSGLLLYSKHRVNSVLIGGIPGGGGEPSSSGSNNLPGRGGIPSGSDSNNLPGRGGIPSGNGSNGLPGRGGSPSSSTDLVPGATGQLVTTAEYSAGLRLPHKQTSPEAELYASRLGTSLRLSVTSERVKFSTSQTGGNDQTIAEFSPNNALLIVDTAVGSQSRASSLQVFGDTTVGSQSRASSLRVFGGIEATSLKVGGMLVASGGPGATTLTMTNAHGKNVFEIGPFNGELGLTLRTKSPTRTDEVRLYVDEVDKNFLTVEGTLSVKGGRLGTDHGLYVREARGDHLNHAGALYKYDDKTFLSARSNLTLRVWWNLQTGGTHSSLVTFRSSDVVFQQKTLQIGSWIFTEVRDNDFKHVWLELRHAQYKDSSGSLRTVHSFPKVPIGDLS